jgi:hypothetical protein
MQLAEDDGSSGGLAVGVELQQLVDPKELVVTPEQR